MAGISSNALKGTNYPENRIKLFGKEIQNKEFSDESGLEWYAYGMREYDQKIGRFFRVDPITEKFYALSPYQYCANDPVKNVDLDGAEELDFRLYNTLIQNTLQNPNGTSAKLLGSLIGVGGSVRGMAEGVFNAISHPVQTVEGLARMTSQSTAQNAADYGVNVASQYINAGNNTFSTYATGAHIATDIAMALSPIKEGAFTKEGALAKNVFGDLTSINDIGKTGEALTKGVLEKQFPGAEILQQVDVKMDGANMTADFVVVKEGKIIGMFESKVNNSKLSNGQKLFFNDGDAGILSGKNAGRFKGVQVDPSNIQTGVYRWDSKTMAFTVQ
ncbi:RHS repeat-associated protein [Chitinophaga niastensis]|uniref:RHS repeat-associated protein n=2 Tax=Chitinophaga niastensis TaxID=536980 RepID=A0A2P8H804_CHINA|nr:RHS repeat-associated protein [Chitinophaga niastensis]